MNPSLRVNVSSLSPLLESGDLNGEQLDTQNMLQQICSIVDIIDRDHMKVWTIVDIIDRDHMKVWTIVDIIDRDHMKVWTIVDIIDRDHMKVWTASSEPIYNSITRS